MKKSIEEIQTYFIAPFMIKYTSVGSLIKSKKIVKDHQVEEFLREYDKTSNLNILVMSITRRYKEIMVANKCPFQIDHRLKVECPAGCVNRELYCFDCTNGEYFVSIHGGYEE